MPITLKEVFDGFDACPPECRPCRREMRLAPYRERRAPDQDLYECLTCGATMTKLEAHNQNQETWSQFKGGLKLLDIIFNSGKG